MKKDKIMKRRKVTNLLKDIFINFPEFLFYYVIEKRNKYKTEQIKLVEMKMIRLSKFIVLVYGGLVYATLVGVGIWLITLPITLGLGIAASFLEIVFNKYIGTLLILYVTGLIFFINTKKVND